MEGMEAEKYEPKIPEKTSDIYKLIDASLDALTDRLEEEANIYAGAFWAEHHGERSANPTFKPLLFP